MKLFEKINKQNQNITFYYEPVQSNIISYIDDYHDKCLYIKPSNQYNIIDEARALFDEWYRS
mgnify:FL=1|tara:strand:- start:431 stop:616 length:186 start_codon:yes stop_codon:yes gene_type:complete